MIYECDKCGAALPPGAMACPKCDDSFEEPVPMDAELPARGFSARPAASAPDPVPAAHPTYPWLDAPAQPGTPPPRTKESPAKIIGALLFVFIVAPLSVMGLYNSAKDPARATSSQAARDAPVTSASPASDVPPPDAPSVEGDTSEPGGDLRVGSENFTKESDYDIVTGEVTNTSGHALADVEAVTTFYDASGGVVKSEEALIDFNPIMPGQTSTYKTMGTDNPLIKREKTAFQVMGGAELATTTAPPPEPAASDSSASGDSAASADTDPATATSGSGQSDEPLSRHKLQSETLTDGDLEGLSLAALSVSYNSIYAAHGYVFKRASLRRIFLEKPWYHPDGSFSEKDLSKTEQANLKTTRAFERSRFNY